MKYATAYVVLPGGFGTLDELTEILTLIQTGKIRPIPVLLIGSEFCKGLVDWLKVRVAAECMIDAKDLDFFKLLDRPEEVVNAIFEHYATRGVNPSAEERETMLEL